MRLSVVSYAVALGVMAAVGCPGQASTLTYTPINPAFGGSPLNSSYLLGVASAINKYKDTSSTTTTDAGTLFVQQLQGQLLSALSTQITNIIFGANAQQSGTITFGDQSIAFVKGLEAVHLTITNSSTGAVTSINIPVLQSSGATSTSGTGQ